MPPALHGPRPRAHPHRWPHCRTSACRARTIGADGDRELHGGTQTGCARDGDGTSVELEGRDVWERRAYALLMGRAWDARQPQRASIYTFGGESGAATHPIALVYDVNRAVMCAFGDLNFVTCAVAAMAYGPRCVSVCPRWAYVK